jgi:iron complex transport system substrate-binding protein
MPQKRAFFARENVARSPRRLVGLFYFVNRFSRQGRLLNFAARARLVSASLGTFVLLLLCGAGPLQAQSAPQAPAAVPQFREVVDEAGRTVRIPQPVLRIVSLAPSLTETVYALGVQDRLAGDTDYCDYPPEAQKKPKVGGALNPSLEEIAALHPDLVLATKGLNRLDTVLALQTLNIPAYATDPHTVDQIISSTLRLAEILGASDAGATLAADLKRRLDDLDEHLASVPPRRVLFVVWDEPLISVGKDTFIADALRHAGAASIVESTQSWPQMSLEEVVRQQPDFLVFAESHSPTGSVDLDALASRPGWRGLEAVRHRRFAVISEAVNRPAPRIVSAIEDLARQLHPEAFERKAVPATALFRPARPQDDQHLEETCACVL